MGKSVGFIGNFKGKLGNTVGYKVSQSNSGTNQGVRVYQPNIKNPKSAAQAEQRAKYAPIFATYNALKNIIDRGNESKPYGNASRIAWLKKAFRSSVIPWTPQGSTVKYPIGCQLTQGSLNDIAFTIQTNELKIVAPSIHDPEQFTEVSELAGFLLDDYPYLKEGDQFTLVVADIQNQSLQFKVESYIMDPNDDTPLHGWGCEPGRIVYYGDDVIIGAAIIISREGAKGEHLRSTSFLTLNADEVQHAPYDDASKQSAIASYMASTGANADWAEESIQ